MTRMLMMAPLTALFLLICSGPPAGAKERKTQKPAPRAEAADASLSNILDGTVPSSILERDAGGVSGLPLHPPTTAPITVNDVFARLRDLDERMKTLTLSISQSVRLEEGGAAQSKQADLSYRKPRRLRIEYRQPEPQTVVTDGRKLWVWRKWTNQVIESTFEDWKRSEPALEGILNFGDYASLRKRYRVSVATISAPGDDGHRTFQLELLPKDKTAAFVLSLTLSTRDYFPKEAALAAGGAHVRTRFVDIRFNPDVPRSVFEFIPPKDADVFRHPSGP